jgi:hypothetical protein
MTTIMQFDPRPRGTVMGRQISGPVLSEAQHFRKCFACGGYFDRRDLVWISATFRAAAAPGM